MITIAAGANDTREYIREFQFRWETFAEMYMVRVE